MGINGGITSSSSQIFTLSVRNMLSVSLNVSLGQSEVQNENLVGSFVQSDAEVIGFYVSMDEMSVVDVLNS